MPIRAALFDFDGTLADSFVAITASTNHVRDRYGLSPLTEAEVRSHVGLGLTQLMTDLVPPAPPAEAVAAYREHHPSVMAAGTRLFPGVADTLAALHARGVKLAVCSNKSVAFTKRLVESLGLRELFAEVLGPEDVGVPKPDPAMLVEALRRLAVPPAEAVYVGDMVIDVDVARAAGMPVWVVPGGASPRDVLEAANPDRLLRDFAELVKLI